MIEQSYSNDPERQAEARAKQLDTMRRLGITYRGSEQALAIFNKTCERCTIKFSGEPCKELPGVYCAMCHADLPCPCRNGRVIDLTADYIQEKSSIESIQPVSAVAKNRRTKGNPRQLMRVKAV